MRGIAGALLRNPLDLLTWPDPGRTLARRADQLADGLGADRSRVRARAFAQAVLSAAWTDEDFGRRDEHALGCADLLDAR